MPNEIWKDVPGYEGRYQVSNLGRVKSLEREVCNQYSCRIISEQLMSLQLWLGYQVVWFRMPGQKKKKKYRVHRLVASVFIPIPDPESDEVNHKDKNRCNNTVENLEWLNHQANCQHRDNFNKDEPF